MTRRFLLILVSCLLLVSCNLPQGTGPQAWIDAPLDGSTLPLAQTEIVFHAYAAGNPKAVELTINGQPFTLISPDLSQPLSTLHAQWNPTDPGRYVIATRTQDQKGVWSESHTHTVVIGEPIITITPTESPTPIPLGITITPSLTPTETPTVATVTPLTVTRLPGNVFSNLSVSTNIFYRLDATPTKVTFSIDVNDPAGIKIVEIYFRLRDPNTDETTEWTNEAMSTLGRGVYTFTLSRSHPAFASTSPKTMILEYQFIVTHTDQSLVRSPVYSDVTLKKN